LDHHGGRCRGPRSNCGVLLVLVDDLRGKERLVWLVQDLLVLQLLLLLLLLEEGAISEAQMLQGRRRGRRRGWRPLRLLCLLCLMQRVQVGVPLQACRGCGRLQGRVW